MYTGRKLNKRQEDVLKIVVASHVRSALPIGSSAIADVLGLSSATIRNVMAELEEMEYIMHPHPSAGRIPTDEGYRYYIDSLMRVKGLSGTMADNIAESYNHDVHSLEDVMEKTSSLMSDLTRYVGITVDPESERLYLNGASHIIEQPEFRDFEKLRAIFTGLEDKMSILHFLRGGMNDGRLAISVGRENRINNLKDCSVVSKGYKRNGIMSGRLGVIGPRRMVYEEVVPMVEFLSEIISKVLDGMDA